MKTSSHLATLPPEQTKPFEGMTQLITLVIEEAYRLCTEQGGGAKGYRRGRRARGRRRDPQVRHQAA